MEDAKTIQWVPADMLEVTLDEPDDFLKVRETLTRIGISVELQPSSLPTLYQSCHILHKQGRYFIVHFKELFMLDGKQSSFTADDEARRNTIAILLADWGLLSLSALAPENVTTLKHIKIIPFKDKSNWNLEVKYTIGSGKK